MSGLTSSPRADLLSTATVIGFVAYLVLRMLFSQLRPISGFFLTVGVVFGLGLLYRLISETTARVLGELRQIADVHEQSLRALEATAAALSTLSPKKELTDVNHERESVSA